MNNAPMIITSALAELRAELGTDKADLGCKVKIEGKHPVIASGHQHGKSRVAQG